MLTTLLQRLFQDPVLEHLIGHLHAAIFPAPAAAGLLADIGFPTDQRDGLPTIGLAQDADHLRGRVASSSFR